MLRSRMVKRMIGTFAALSLLCTGACAADAGEIIHEGTMNTYHELGGTYAREFACDDGSQSDAVEAAVVETETADETIGTADGDTGSTSGKQDTASTDETAVSKKVYITVDELNVRDAADVSGLMIGTVYQGVLVEVVAETGSWYKIQYNGGYGYICKRYTLEDDGEAEPAEPAGDDANAEDVNPAEQEPSAEAVVVTGDTADAAVKTADAAEELTEAADFRKSADETQCGGMEHIRAAAQAEMQALSAKWHAICGED